VGFLNRLGAYRVGGRRGASVLRLQLFVVLDGDAQSLNKTLTAAFYLM
jgi:hypothetical protein